MAFSIQLIALGILIICHPYALIVAEVGTQIREPMIFFCYGKDQTDRENPRRSFSSSEEP